MISNIISSKRPALYERIINRSARTKHAHISLESANDCLTNYLAEKIFPQLAPSPYGKIEIGRVPDHKYVYVIKENIKNITVVGKCFHRDDNTLEQAWQQAQTEYLNLRFVRTKLRANSNGCHIAKPLGINKELCALLVTEKVPGRMLDHYIARAIYENNHQQLFNKLERLASLFSELHGIKKTRIHLSMLAQKQYLSKILDSLEHFVIEPEEKAGIEKNASRWWEREDICRDDFEVLVHGDATPTNFFFHKDEVIAIDMEKMKRADRCWDLGFLAAELKHNFMWRMGNGIAAEPFIGHFLWKYATACGDTQIFYAVTRRLPLYMALGLLRIARNPWLDLQYRKQLVHEAKRCLKYEL